ncbi:hypothetical protein PTSG_02058 [Salpingoeca rosetta]|uniref:PROP1-like PPR domain-containing protein n=1 Tax=Salpingoeca rosetta (strain ATCC 50818 / BSB-021) TaxID=946362 RepID=F2TZR7_SALR5|nr:uncharacterized protein PTSG_02058 [Salpingoeca rosetta]EGD79091.1 hypothetical protein PTSG_02058 [Salpingoeca rosetta]|eukprot:XP_004998047.1 hypothetical protein PTSG_02058 [Salpingoeca rosetta]
MTPDQEWLVMQINHLLIATYAEVPDTEAVTSVLARLLFLGVQPTKQTYNHVVRAYEAAGDASRLEFLIKSLEDEHDGGNPDARVPDHWYASLMRVYRTTRDVESALALMERAADRGVKDTAPIISDLAVVAAATGSVRWADTMVRDMEDAGMTPSGDAYLHIIRAYSDQLDISGAQQALARAQTHAHALTDEHYEALVTACLAVDDDAGVRRVQQELRQHQRRQQRARSQQQQQAAPVATGIGGSRAVMAAAEGAVLPAGNNGDAAGVSDVDPDRAQGQSAMTHHHDGDDGGEVVVGGAVPEHVQAAWQQGFQLHMLAPDRFAP